MKRLAILSLSSFLTACSFVHTQESTYFTVGHAKVEDSTYFTVGHAKVEECAQVVHVDDKEDIKFNCKTYYSEGVSAEFAGIIKALFGWVPWPF